MSSPAISVNRENFPKEVTDVFSRDHERRARSAAAELPAQIALNSSNGCRQALQYQIDLHAVDPNTLRCSVSSDLQ